MEDCVFCKISSGKISSHKIDENDDFFAFLDNYPNTEGHTLIIPKKHYRWTYEVPNFGEYFEFAKKVALASMKGLKADWLSFFTVGLEVPHAHIHSIPRYKNDGHGAVVSSDIHKKFTEKEFSETAIKIKNAL